MNNGEFLTWQQQWQSHHLVPVERIRRVERLTNRMKALHIAEIGVTILVGGGLIGASIAHPLTERPYWVARTLATCLFIVAQCVIRLRISRNPCDQPVA